MNLVLLFSNIYTHKGEVDNLQYINEYINE